MGWRRLEIVETMWDMAVFRGYLLGPSPDLQTRRTVPLGVPFWMDSGQSIMSRKLLSHVHLAGTGDRVGLGPRCVSPGMSFIRKALLAVTVTYMLKHLLGRVIAGGNFRALFACILLIPRPLLAFPCGNVGTVVRRGLSGD